MNVLDQYINAKQRALNILKQVEMDIRYDRVESAAKLLWNLLNQVDELVSLLEQAKREV